MANTFVNSQKQQALAWLNGQYIKPEQDNRGYYYIDKDGKRIDLRNPILKFSSEPAEITKKFIHKREEENEILEANISSFEKDYKNTQEKLKKYLLSLGFENIRDANLTGVQETKVHKFEHIMSFAQHSINRAKMTIRGNLLSNFMDYCSLIKLS